MESRAKDKTCLVEQTTTLIVDGAVAARRKRMEIRRFKKLSCSPTSSKSLNLVHQGAFKRHRPVRTSSICYHGKVGEDGSDNLGEPDIPFTSNIVAQIDTKSTMLEGSRLIRSKSFPLQCSHSSRCVLHITKMGDNSMAMDGKKHYNMTVVSEECGSTEGELSSEVCAWTGEATSSPCLSKGARVMETGKDESHDGPCSRYPIKGSRKMETVKEQPLASLLPGGLSIVNALPLPKGDAQLGGNAIPSLHLVESMNPMSSEQVGMPGNNVCEQDVTMVGSSARISLDNREENLSTFCASRGVLPDISISARSPGQCPSSGKVLICGRRREMEDMAVIVPSFTRLPSSATPDSSFDLHFFAVYDGHGGSQASKYCAERLHHALTEEFATSSFSSDLRDVFEWKKVMSSCFSKMDREVGGVCPNGACDNANSMATCCVDTIAPENVGTTAVVAVFSPFQIVVANCGDSRAVLSRGGFAIPLSKDHKPNTVEETTRIEAAGGRVIYWDGYRVSGLLALSRAIGDRYLKQYIISEPDVVCVSRNDDDECLILASDGLWDVISNETACDVARRCLASAHRRAEHTSPDKAATSVAALLVKLAYGRGSKDNISVVVIDLRSRCV